jgi:hypothetical protein
MGIAGFAPTRLGVWKGSRVPSPLALLVVFLLDPVCITPRTVSHPLGPSSPASGPEGARVSGDPQEPVEGERPLEGCGSSRSSSGERTV